jgi:hypothetical protein
VNLFLEISGEYVAFEATDLTAVVHYREQMAVAYRGFTVVSKTNYKERNVVANFTRFLYFLCTT